MPPQRRRRAVTCRKAGGLGQCAQALAPPCSPKAAETRAGRQARSSSSAAHRCTDRRAQLGEALGIRGPHRARCALDSRTRVARLLPLHLNQLRAHACALYGRMKHCSNRDFRLTAINSRVGRSERRSTAEPQHAAAAAAAVAAALTDVHVICARADASAGSNGLPHFVRTDSPNANAASRASATPAPGLAVPSAFGADVAATRTWTRRPNLRPSRRRGLTSCSCSARVRVRAHVCVCARAVCVSRVRER